MALAQKMIRAALSALLLHLVLIQPNHPAAIGWDTLRLFPLELPAILLALIAFGAGRLGRTFRGMLVIALTTLASLKAADLMMFQSLNRGFNPVADLPLIASLYDLVVGAFGPVAAAAATVLGVLGVMALTAALWWACRVWSRLSPPGQWPKVAGLGAIMATTITIADVGDRLEHWSLPAKPPGTSFTARLSVERVQMIHQTLVDLRAFRLAAKSDPFASEPGLFDLVDRDVLIIFVESYGRTSLDTPLYAGLHRETLQKAQTDLEARGLSTASSLLLAPTQGGQSWLSHASFANGLWVENQTAYGAALTSGRQTLFHLAARSGFHTAAVMPQITLDWPESQFMGFETILAAEDLGYQGLPFNWITMPDQFTFAALDRLLRDVPDRDRPLFVQMATGSSHAPWVPVPELLPWDRLDDGTIYNDLVEASDPPRVVWKDYDRVRAQYRLAIDYALQVVFNYAARHAEDPPLMIVIGDHQAATVIGRDERPHVPIHLIGPAYLVERLSDAQFNPGLIPNATETPRSMADMREHLLRALSSTKLSEVGG